MIETSITKRPWWNTVGEGNDGFVYDHTDSLTIDGITYTRWSSGQGKPAIPPTGHFTARGIRSTPGVICGNPNCLGVVFILSYGSDEIRAKCAVCGLEDVVYDG